MQMLALQEQGPGVSQSVCQTQAWLEHGGAALSVSGTAPHCPVMGLGQALSPLFHRR